MSDGQRRRVFLQQMGAGLVLPMAFAPRDARAATQVKATTTNLTSSNERMISYRHQQHMWQTPDGALHLMLNRGALTPGPNLSIWSSFDGGSTWSLVTAFDNTDDKCTGDVLGVGNDASFVFHTADFKVMYGSMQYDPVLKTWSPAALETAYSSGKYGGLNPTLAVDDLGTVWVGFLCRNRFNSACNVRVVNRVGGGNVWTDPGLAFGTADTRSVERSARPIRIPGGVGMVWTVREVTYWSTRTNDLPDNSAWTTSTLFTGAVTSTLEDPYASHFNVIADALGNVHVITIENYDVLYFRLAAGSSAWSAPLVVDDSRKVAYAQLGLADGKLVVAFSVQRGKGALAVSSDLGMTWTPAYDLALLAIGPGINFNTARIELLTRATGGTVALQQYEDNGTQRLMVFKVPGPL